MNFNREPIVWITFIAGAIKAVFTIAVNNGIITIAPDQVQNISNLIDLLLAIVGGFLARSFVTPVSDPRDAKGQPLT